MLAPCLSTLIQNPFINIKANSNSIEITTDIPFRTALPKNFAFTDNLENKGYYDRVKLTVVAKIDISKGTNEIGFPKGLEISIAKKQA